MHPTLLFLSIFITLSVAYLGDIIEYKPRSREASSCHLAAVDDAPVVAISVAMMNNQPHEDPVLNRRCESKIKIWNEVTYKAWEAYVIDTCESCGYMDLALSPGLFRKVAPYAKGRTHNIAWGGHTVGG